MLKLCFKVRLDVKSDREIWHVQTCCFKNCRVLRKLIQNLNFLKKIVPKIVFSPKYFFVRIMLFEKVRKCQPWRFCGVKLPRELKFWGQSSLEFLVSWVQLSFKILCFIKFSSQNLTSGRNFYSSMTSCRNAVSDSKES